MTKQPPGKCTSGKAELNSILLIKRPALCETIFSVRFVKVMLGAGVSYIDRTLFWGDTKEWDRNAPSEQMSWKLIYVMLVTLRF